MALGTPVVATAVGGVSDAVHTGQTGWLVPPAQPVALAEAIWEALCQRSMAIDCATHARKHVERDFGLAAHLSALRTLYESVAAG
jgi:glycosyltransferase involved in cell wall biosynthesis